MNSVNQAKGIIALTDATSESCTAAEPRSWRLFLVVFLVRMWRLNAWPRLMEPLPRTLKRFAAPFLVFILGMMQTLLMHDGGWQLYEKRLLTTQQSLSVFPA